MDAAHAVSDAVSELNEHQKRIRFSVERGTQAVCLKLIEEASAPQRRGTAEPRDE